MSEVVTPRLARRLVALLLGLLGGVGLAAPAQAAGVPDLDRLPAQSQRGTETPQPQAPAGTSAPTGNAAPSSGVERRMVKPGDSLWRLAERQLKAADPDRVKPPRTDRIDQQWREWYQLNRAEIGSDPDVIRTGSWLHVPEIADSLTRTTPTTTTGSAR